METDAGIEIANVTKTFGKHTVLDQISLHITPGTIVGLLGPSGCGKTTLVNLIMGLTVPTKGTVKVMGELAPFPQARVAMGFMPQDEALYADITAAENLSFFGSLYGLSKKEIATASARALELARLQDQGKKVVSAFSGGMKRRLSLAIALLHSPQVLILDEPTVGLDPLHRAKLWESFHQLSASGSTVVVTTHMMSEAWNCDKVAVLREGKLIAFDSPAQIIAHTQTADLEQAFIALATQQGAEPTAPDPSANPHKKGASND